MKAFFDTRERIATLQMSAAKWIGTPFVPHADVCGAGVDCVNLCAQIYRATGFLGEVRLPAYTLDGGKHNPESQLLAWLDARPDFVAINSTDEPQPGDLLCFSTGRSAHHSGLVLHGPHFIHAMFSRVVVQGTLRDRTFSRRLVAVYRPIEP